LPWVGSVPKTSSERDMYAPPPGSHFQKAVPVEGNATIPDQYVHPSLRGEVHPDKPGTARPG
jgi:hypothetical protein